MLVVVIAMLPAYVLFALMLVLLSTFSTRMVGWRTPADVTLPISSLDPRLLTWVQSMVMLHLVRVLAGSIFRATPIWSLYLRLNGARLGRRVFVNSLAVVDHNLLEFGDDVIIGDGAHVAGHTIEDGLLKTARVRFGRGVTIGVGSVVGIGVDAGSGCRVGALSVVPKFTRLDADATYVGAPVRKLGGDNGQADRDARAKQQTVCEAPKSETTKAPRMRLHDIPLNPQVHDHRRNHETRNTPQQASQPCSSDRAEERPSEASPFEGGRYDSVARKRQ